MGRRIHFVAQYLLVTMNSFPSDQELLARIGQGDQAALEMIYKAHRPVIFQYVVRHGGTWQDAQDIYQDVILAFHANVAAGRLTHLTGKLSTYLYRLAANQWHTRLRTAPRWVSSEALDDRSDESVPNEAAEDALLHQLIGRLDDRCRCILQLYYFDRLPMREVAHRVGLADGESARKRKCDCLGKLRKLAEQHPELDTGF